MMASMNGNTKAVRMLINAKADVNAKNNNGATALMVAATSGHTEVVRGTDQCRSKCECQG